MNREKRLFCIRYVPHSFEFVRHSLPRESLVEKMYLLLLFMLYICIDIQIWNLNKNENHFLLCIPPSNFRYFIKKYLILHYCGDCGAVQRKIQPSTNNIISFSHNNKQDCDEMILREI